MLGALPVVGELHRRLDLAGIIDRALPNDALPFGAEIGYLPSDHPPYQYGAGLYADATPHHAAVFHYG